MTRAETLNPSDEIGWEECANTWDSTRTRSKRGRERERERERVKKICFPPSTYRQVFQDRKPLESSWAFDSMVRQIRTLCDFWLYNPKSDYVWILSSIGQKCIVASIAIKWTIYFHYSPSRTLRKRFGNINENRLHSTKPCVSGERSKYLFSFCFLVSSGYSIKILYAV